MSFDLNNSSETHEKHTENTLKEDSTTSSSSSVVNVDDSPISVPGIYNFFQPTFITHQLFPGTAETRPVGVGVGSELEMLRLGPTLLQTSSSSSSVGNNNNSNQWLNLSVSGTGTGTGEVVVGKQQVRRSRRGPRSRSSQYRGVTFYRRTGRWESHIWDCGKQVYLGGFDTAHAAARAYDRAAIKFRGVDADINFSITDYDEDMTQTKNLTKEEFVQVLRRQSTGFSRGSSRYRGVTLHKCGRWEARMGQFVGKKYMYLGLFDSEVEAARAYDNAAVQCNGSDAVTNFEPGALEGQRSLQANTGEWHNLDLNLGISVNVDGPKASNNTRVGESQTQHPPIQLANGKGPMNGVSTYYSPGALPLYGQPMASRQPTTMWSGLTPGRPGTYEEKVKGQKVEAIPLSRLPNWAWYMQSQGQGGGVGGTSGQIQPSSNAASSGFPFSTVTPSSTTLFSHPQTNHSSVLLPPTTSMSNTFTQYGQGRS